MFGWFFWPSGGRSDWFDETAPLPKPAEEFGEAKLMRAPKDAPNDANKWIFLCFPGQNDENIVGKKHGSIDCLPLPLASYVFWGAARSTDKRVVANYYFGEETQWPHSWPEQGSKQANPYVGEFASTCFHMKKHHLDEICCWYTLTCQVSSPICMRSSDVLGSRRGLPKSFSGSLRSQGLFYDSNETCMMGWCCVGKARKSSICRTTFVFSRK